MALHTSGLSGLPKVTTWLHRESEEKKMVAFVNVIFVEKLCSKQFLQ